MPNLVLRELNTKPLRTLHTYSHTRSHGKCWKMWKVYLVFARPLSIDSNVQAVTHPPHPSLLFRCVPLQLHFFVIVCRGSERRALPPSSTYGWGPSGVCLYSMCWAHQQSQHNSDGRTHTHTHTQSRLYNDVWAANNWLTYSLTAVQVHTGIDRASHCLCLCECAGTRARGMRDWMHSTVCARSSIDMPNRIFGASSALCPSSSVHPI